MGKLGLPRFSTFGRPNPLEKAIKKWPDTDMWKHRSLTGTYTQKIKEAWNSLAFIGFRMIAEKSNMCWRDAHGNPEASSWPTSSWQPLPLTHQALMMLNWPRKTHGWQQISLKRHFAWLKFVGPPVLGTDTWYPVLSIRNCRDNTNGRFSACLFTVGPRAVYLPLFETASVPHATPPRGPIVTLVGAETWANLSWVGSWFVFLCSTPQVFCGSMRPKISELFCAGHRGRLFPDGGWDDR
jgi:hypothetical protein